MSTKQAAPAEAPPEAPNEVELPPDTRLDPEPDAVARAPGELLAGTWVRLDRISTVRSGTVVVVSAAAKNPELKEPGDLLLPGWPLSRGVDVLVVNTEPVTLRLRVDHLSTLDREDVTSVDLDVQVRLVESQLLPLVLEHGDDLGPYLVEQARTAVEASVRAAVGLNRAEDLRRQSLARVLADRWLPTTLVRGALVRVGFDVRRVSWAATDADEEPPTVAELLPGPPPAPLSVSSIRPPRSRDRPSAAEALKFVYVPAVISIGAFWIFFIAHWVPELRAFPGAAAVLEQFAPLASAELASRSQPVVSSQVDRSGLPAAFLLLVSLLLAPLARARHWLARLSLWPLTYLAAIGAAVIVLSTLARERLASNFLGVLLLVVWVGAAVVTSWRSLWVDVENLPRRPARVGWLLGVFALLSPAPVALGRSVFAPELHDAALAVLGNDLTLRWAALLTPATALVYLSAVLLGGLVWAVYLFWTPRPGTSRVRAVIVLAVALVALVVVAPQAAVAADRRAEVIRTESPSEEIGLSCGMWTERPGGRPAETLVVTGLQCKRVSAYSGYREVSSIDLGVSLSPVRAETFDGRRIPGRLVAAQYGETLVLAGTDRLDNRVTQLVGLRMANGAPLWRYPCPSPEPPRVRFAGSSAGDDAAAGRVTLRGERAGVVLDCGRGAVRLDPRTGRRL